MKIKECTQGLQTETAFKVLAQAQQLERQGKDIIHLEIGQPDFPTPKHICDAAVEAIREGKTGYGPAPGLPELRETIASEAGVRRGLTFDTNDVIISPGGKPIIFYTIQSLAGKGDEVIFPDPGFPMYASLIAHSGATPVPLPLREEKAFSFDANEFRSRVSERTRLVIINSPHNPTGGIINTDDLEVIAEEAQRHDFIVLSDEIYKDFLYEGSFVSIASLPGMKERTVILDGFSKSYSMTGWRLGYGVVPTFLAEAFELYNVNIASCACTFNQYGALAALQGSQDCVQSMVAEFQSRRDYLVDALNEINGFHCLKPTGAFYAFPNIKETGKIASQLAGDILDNAGIALLAGTSFGKEGEGYLRLSYATSLDNLKTACERLKKYVE
jgi:aspartate/methionine/tyrosine aminotransferase